MMGAGGAGACLSWTDRRGDLDVTCEEPIKFEVGADPVQNLVFDPL